MALPAHSGSRPLIQFRNNFSQTVGLLGRGIHASSGIRTQNPSVRATEDSSCLRPCNYYDRHLRTILQLNLLFCELFNDAFSIETVYEVVSESSRAVTAVTASVKEDDKGGQGHTSESLLHQSAT
jgi:hypothetical protein